MPSSASQKGGKGSLLSIPTSIITALSRLSSSVCCTVNGDYLVYDGDGVFGITDVSASSDRAYLAKRSINIEKGLYRHSPEEIRNAVACSCNGRYHLFIGDTVYIADTRYKFRESNALSSHHQYEWWIWTGVNALSVCSHKGKIYIGTEDGRIYTEGSGYRDISIVKNTREGDYICVNGDICLNKHIPTDESTIVRFKGTRSLFSDGEFTADIFDGKPVISALYPFSQVEIGDTVSLILKNGESFDCTVEYSPYNEELGLLTLSLKEGETSFSPDEIMEIRLEETGKREYSLKKNGNAFTLMLDNKEIKVYSCAELSFLKATDVCAEFYTPMLNFDEPLRAKTLIRIGISAANEDTGSISFGWETRKSALIKLNGLDRLDLASFDFDKLSFDLPFAKTYERRVFERNFNYIMFKFSSLENKDCAINEINAVYTVNNYIYGVR